MGSAVGGKGGRGRGDSVGLCGKGNSHGGRNSERGDHSGRGRGGHVLGRGGGVVVGGRVGGGVGGGWGEGVVVGNGGGVRSRARDHVPRRA